MQNDYYSNLYRLDGEIKIPYVNSGVLDHGPFMENNLLLNIDKEAIFHMSFPDSINERDRVFKGTIIEVSRDHVMLRSLDNDKAWFMLPITYLNYVEFLEQPLIYRLTS